MGFSRDKSLEQGVQRGLARPTASPRRGYGAAESAARLSSHLVGAEAPPFDGVPLVTGRSR